MCVGVDELELHRSFVLSAMLVFARMRVLKFLVQHFFYVLPIFFFAAPAGAFILYVCAIIKMPHARTHRDRGTRTRQKEKLFSVCVCAYEALAFWLEEAAAAATTKESERERESGSASLD